jgi:hypothetical protein
MPAEVVMIGACHGPRMKAIDMGHTKTSDVTAEAPHVSSTKAADVAAAEAAHAAPSVASTATAASGLGTRGWQASRQHCAY